MEVEVSLTYVAGVNVCEKCKRVVESQIEQCFNNDTNAERKSSRYVISQQHFSS